MDHDKLEVVATIKMKPNEELYKIVDFLNKHLKDKNVIFGLTKENEYMAIKMYEI